MLWKQKSDHLILCSKLSMTFLPRIMSRSFQGSTKPTRFGPICLWPYPWLWSVTTLSFHEYSRQHFTSGSLHLLLLKLGIYFWWYICMACSLVTFRGQMLLSEEGLPWSPTSPPSIFPTPCPVPHFSQAHLTSILSIFTYLSLLLTDSSKEGIFAYLVLCYNPSWLDQCYAYNRCPKKVFSKLMISVRGRGIFHHKPTIFCKCIKYIRLK